MKRAELYLNTVKNLKPIQIEHQISNRIFKERKSRLIKVVKSFSVPKEQRINVFIPELDCEKSYLERFDIQKLLDGSVELLHETHRVEETWCISGASHLWNYNLHYLEFLIPLAARYSETADERLYEKWRELTESWLGQEADDSFEPYTISMRIPNLLISMELLGERVLDAELYHRILDSIYQQYRYLLRTQELALLANHYFENLKTIVISSLLFNELEIYRKYFDLLLQQIDEQILPDGMHFELSPMYHRIILEDLLRVHTVLNSCRHKGDAEKIIPAIQAMASAVACLEKGFGRIPLFNDSGNNVAKKKEALLRAAQKICAHEIIEAENLQFAGYYKLYQNNISVLFDCGGLSPSYMGGHAHCDCLSFELAVGEKLLFTNSGTGQYQGELRNFFRSTAAHNTVMIDDREQSELWGEHRAGRRISGWKGTQTDTGVIGRFTSFRGDEFRRQMQWKHENVLIIKDEFRTYDKGKHIARQFFHLAPGYQYERSENRIYIKEDNLLAAVLYIPSGSDYLIHKEGRITNYAEDFGEYLHKQVLEICTPFEDRVQLETEISIQKAGRK